MNDIERLAERDYNFLLRNIRKLFGMSEIYKSKEEEGALDAIALGDVGVLNGT